VFLFDRFLSRNATARSQQSLSPDDISETDPIFVSRRHCLPVDFLMDYVLYRF